MKEKKYTRIRLGLAGFDPDILSAVLFRYNAAGIEEFNDETWIVSFNEVLSFEQVSQILKQLREMNADFDSAQFASAVYDYEDWNAEWRKHFKPLKIGERVWVAPPWEQPEPAENDILITVDPQMAFGTGSHETTQLMICAVEKYAQPGQTVLDAGTGSGILSILVKKMGAASVFAFDVEDDAIENALHNADLNKVHGLEFAVGNESAVPKKQFDLVLANINRNVLLDMLPFLFSKVSKRGTLILSGLLNTDEQIIRENIPGDFKVIEKLTQKEWIALVIR